MLGLCYLPKWRIFFSLSQLSFLAAEMAVIATSWVWQLVERFTRYSIESKQRVCHSVWFVRPSQLQFIGKYRYVRTLSSIIDMSLQSGAECSYWGFMELEGCCMNLAMNRYMAHYVVVGSAFMSVISTLFHKTAFSCLTKVFKKVQKYTSETVNIGLFWPFLGLF